MAQEKYTDAELVEMAHETTYRSSLMNYLRQAQSEEAKSEIRSIIDELRTYGELEG